VDSQAAGAWRWRLSTSVTANRKRFKGDFTCPVCKGTEDEDRGQGTRCFGYLSGGSIVCTREDYAGQAPYEVGPNGYRHNAKGPCPCGKEHAPSDKKKMGPIDRVYKYHDAAGKVAFETVRFKNPKDFRQRRPAPHGKPVWNLSGVATVLYQLPELITADPTRTVWIAEGEKDVDRLRLLGEVATCNPMGAGKWFDNYAEPLRDRICRILPDNDEPGRQHAEKIARTLRGKALSVAIVELPGLPDKGDVSDFLDSGGTLEQLIALAKAAPEWTPSKGVPEPSSNGAARHDDKRPEIEVNTERHLCVETTIKALAADKGLYRRGDSLGTVVEEQADAVKLAGGVELQRVRGSLRFLPLSEAALGCVLTRNAHYFHWRVDKSGEWTTSDCHPPNWLISAVATWGHWPGIRSLLGIASSPWVRSDGSIPSPGYDLMTGTLYRPSVKLAPIPDRPTKNDAINAASRLFNLVNDFPFASAGVDCSVWLAGLLTAIQRPAIAGPVPGFVFSGNKAGTGKGLLVDLVGLISGGIAIPTRTYPSDPAEAGKVKLSLAMSGIGAVHFDNLPEGGLYGNSELDSALTSTIVEDRILGQSRESGPVPLRPVWFLTGNNISPGKDAFRRWIPCNLQTDLENPHERSDVTEKDLRRYVEEHRAELLRDALVILKAHAIAGRPACTSAPLGSFEEWDAMVRGAVWFATGNDCLTNQRKAATDSPERAEKMALLEAWHALPRGGNDGAGVTAAEARTLAEEIPGTASKPGIPTQYPALREALLNLSRDSKLPSNRTIGNKLRAMNGQNIGGFKFTSVGVSHQAALWIACKL
jgi:putative DNA primase/helicase